jgi:nitric oxide synthase oxygenase domain/subunit
MLESNASAISTPPTPIAAWALTEFGHAELGDDRRTDRLLMIATAFALQPTAPASLRSRTRHPGRLSLLRE